MVVDSNATSLMNILNSPAPFDVEPSRAEVADSTIQDLFDLHQDHLSSLSTENPSSGDVSGNISVQQLTESISEIADKIDDGELQRAIEVVMSRIDTLKSQTSGAHV